MKIAKARGAASVIRRQSEQLAKAVELARKQRAQLSGYLHSAQERDALLNFQRQEMDEMQNCMAVVESLVSRYSALLPPLSIDVSPSHLRANGVVRVDPYVPTGDFSVADTSSIGHLRAMRIIADLEVITAKVGPNDPMHRGLHVDVTCGGKYVGYAISREILSTIPRNELVRRVADSLARQLVSQL